MPHRSHFILPLWGNFSKIGKEFLSLPLSHTPFSCPGHVFSGQAFPVPLTIPDIVHLLTSSVILFFLSLCPCLSPESILHGGMCFSCPALSFLTPNQGAFMVTPRGMLWIVRSMWQPWPFSMSWWLRRWSPCSECWGCALDIPLYWSSYSCQVWLHLPHRISSKLIFWLVQLAATASPHLLAHSAASFIASITFWGLLSVQQVSSFPSVLLCRGGH